MSVIELSPRSCARLFVRSISRFWATSQADSFPSRVCMLSESSSRTIRSNSPIDQASGEPVGTNGRASNIANRETQPHSEAKAE